MCSLPSEMWIKLENVAPQVEQRVHHSPPPWWCGSALVRNVSDRHRAMVSRVQGVSWYWSGPTPVLRRRTALPRLGDEPLGQRRMDTPVAPFVGIGRPTSSAGPAGGSPCDRARCVDRFGRSRCRAGFPGRSWARPWTGIARRRKASGPGDRRQPVDDPRETSSMRRKSMS